MQIWAYDCEWAPDLTAGRRLYHIPRDVPDNEVMRVMWEASPDFNPDTNPQPFLKTVLCRIVSIAAVIRTDDSRLVLWTVPSLDGHSPSVDDSHLAEAEILRAFLGKYEKNLADHRNPVLVGYNSRNSDAHILLQRALVNGLSFPGFWCEVTATPWKQVSIDLMDFIGGRGKGYSCSLNEIANLCGIPGKLDTTGDDVAGLFYGGRRRKIVEYNVFDALTTYLLWARTELFKGTFTLDEYEAENGKVRDLIETERMKPHGAYLADYLAAWDNLKQEY